MKRLCLAVVLAAGNVHAQALEMETASQPERPVVSEAKTPPNLHKPVATFRWSMPAFGRRLVFSRPNYFANLPQQAVTPARKKPRVWDGKFWTMVAFVLGTAVADVESSQACLQYSTCREGNPIGGRTRGRQYAIKLGGSAAVVGVMYWLKNREAKEIEQYGYTQGWHWWVPGALAGGTWGVVSLHNLKVGNEARRDEQLLQNRH
jgi:hypothetical protein